MTKQEQIEQMDRDSHSRLLWNSMIGSESIHHMEIVGETLPIAELLASVFRSLPHQLERQEAQPTKEIAAGVFETEVPEMPGWDGDDVVAAWSCLSAARQWIEDYPAYGLADVGEYLVPEAEELSDGTILFVTPSRGRMVECRPRGDGKAEFRVRIPGGSRVAAGLLLTKSAEYPAAEQFRIGVGPYR